MGFGELSLKGRAVRSLARRDHSRSELQHKLEHQLRAKLGPCQTDPAGAEAAITAQVRATLDELAASGLQSDDRTAASMLRSLAPRFGSKRIKHSLQSKGLDAGLIASTVAEARSSDLQRAQDLWRRRFGTPPADAKERLRQMRFLAQRGFDGETVRRALHMIGDLHTNGDDGIPG